MVFETSICINEDVKYDILEASLKTGKSACFISKLLIKKAIKLNEKSFVSNQLTEYQEVNKSFSLVKFRYRLSESERVLFSNARQRLNVSISMLLLVGFVLFFKDIVNELCGEQIFQNSYTTVLLFSRIQIANFLVKIKADWEVLKKLE